MKSRNNFKHLLLMMALAITMLPLAAFAQAAKLKMPDFSGLASKATKSVDIDMDRDMLKNAMGFMTGNNTDPQLAESLKGIESLTVKVFSFDKPGVYSMKDIDGVVKQVETRGWKKLLSVNQGNQTVGMWMLDGGARPADGGMFFVAAQPTELVLINIAGKIDLATLSKLQGRMGMPNMGLGGAAPAAPASPASPAAPAAPAAPASPPGQ
ncbi:MAG: DUF4252 domain-containing protein [Pseudomonadota bacterium]